MQAEQQFYRFCFDKMGKFIYTKRSRVAKKRKSRWVALFLVKGKDFSKGSGGGKKYGYGSLPEKSPESSG